MITPNVRLYEIILIIATSLVIVFITPPANTNIKNKTVLLFPPSGIKYFSLGYGEILADVLWIRALQDIDLCGETRAKNLSASRLASEKTTISKNDILNVDRLVLKCDDGWSAHMIDAITELAPKFKLPYMVGGTILSVVVHDNLGAGRIFKKGVERFPGDWPMEYRAAYHFMSGLGDYKTASEYLVMAGNNGAPSWVYALASRLQTSFGQASLSKPILEEAIQVDPKSRYVPELQKRLDEVNAIIEKGE